MKVLSAIQSKQLQDLINFLYVTVVAEVTGSVPQVLRAKTQTWLAGAKQAGANLDTDIVEQCIPILKGKENDLSEGIRSLRAGLRTEVYNDANVPHATLDQLKALTAYLNSKNEPQLRKVISLNSDPDIAKSLVIQPKSQKEFLKPLERIVKAATGDKGRFILSAEEGKALKASNPVVYAEYLRLRKSYNSVWKDELRSLVLASKKSKVDYQQMRKQLTAAGIQNPMSEEFEGLIDANGKIYTVAGKELPGLPGAGFTVRMNLNYDPKTDNGAVFTTHGPDGKVSQHVYTLDYRKEATKQKFEKVANLDTIIDGIRSKWMTYVKKGTQDPQVIASTVLELLYTFSARVGSMGNQAGGKDTYGIATLLVKDAKVDRDKITFSYLGKDAVRQRHVIMTNTPEGKLLYKIIVPLLQNKTPKDRIFTYVSNGKTVPMTGNLVNRWFQKLGAPEGVTVHKLRHVRGTRLFNELVEKNEGKLFNEKKPLTEAQAIAAWKALATQVGALLGHVKGVGVGQKTTGATAIANYIDPGVQAAFFDRIGVRRPKALLKFG